MTISKFLHLAGCWFPPLQNEDDDNVAMKLKVIMDVEAHCQLQRAVPLLVTNNMIDSNLPISQ